MHTHLCLACIRTCVWHFECFLFTRLFLLIPSVPFPALLMSIPAPDEISMENPLCDSSFGGMVFLDYVTHLTLIVHPPRGNRQGDPA